MRTHHWVDASMAAAAIVGGVTVGWPGVVTGVTLAAGIRAWGVFSPRSSLYLPVVWRLPAATGAVFPTYDDGPDPEQTPRILDQLAAAGATASFFVVGSQVRRYPAVVRRMAAQGHVIGLHSDSHSHWFNLWPAWRVEQDLRNCAAAIADATGKPAPLLFRPPVGLKNPIVGRVAQKLGLRCVTWTAGGRDGESVKRLSLVKLFTAAVRPGAIILLHDGQDAYRPRPRPHALALTAVMVERAAKLGLRVSGLHVDSVAELKPKLPMPRNE